MQPLAVSLFIVLLAILAPASSHSPAHAQNDICAQFSDLSPPTAKDSTGNEIPSANVSQLVIIFSTFSNPCDYERQIVVVTEVRDQDNATVFFQSAPANAGAFNSSEVGALWSPESAGTFELRSFAIFNSTGSHVLTELQTRELQVIDYDLVNV